MMVLFVMVGDDPTPQLMPPPISLGQPVASPLVIVKPDMVPDAKPLSVMHEPLPPPSMIVASLPAPVSVRPEFAELSVKPAW